MKVFGFVKWWWNNLETFEKVMLGVPTYMILLVSSALLFGFIGAMVVLFLAFILLVCFFVFSIYKQIMIRWEMYNRIIESERDQIIDRLKGEA
jgi:hypothetical protein